MMKINVLRVFHSSICARPVLTEKVNLYECFESGFHTLLSTETALLNVINNLLMTSDLGSVSLLILLDVSSAFDSFSRLEAFGVSGTALSWFIHTCLTINIISLSASLSLLLLWFLMVFLRVLLLGLYFLSSTCLILERLSAIMASTFTVMQTTPSFISVQQLSTAHKCHFSTY